MTKQEYNEEPVCYCKRCLSLKVLIVPQVGDLEYCGDCGSTLIGQCSNDDWETLYLRRYGHSFLNKK